MTLLDTLGSPKHLFATRLTDKEQRDLDNYKKLYEKKHGKEPSNSRLGRKALMEYLHRELMKLQTA